MKIIGIGMVRNEDDIVESFVRHNLGFLDRLKLVSHCSTDRTNDILAKLRDEGLPLDFETSDEIGFRQGECVTGLARRAFAEGADIVAPLDADEFIKAPSRQKLQDIFSLLPPSANATWTIQSYVPLASDDGAQIDPARRIVHRRAAEDCIVHRALLTSNFAHDPAQCLLEGSHSVFKRSGSELKGTPHALLKDFSLAHFPLRSQQQLAKKILVNVWSRMAAPHELEASHPIALHWKKVYRQILDEGMPSLEQLSILAFIYQNIHVAKPECDRAALVHDPLPIRYELRYTPDNPYAYLQSIAGWVDGLLDARR